MKDGYIKVAAATPKVKVADTVYNGQLIKALMKECTDNGAKVVVFPELCITGYTCQDLFWQDKLIAAAEDELIGIADYSRSLDGIFFIGLPYEINGMLYNMAAVVSRGEVLAMVPKTFLPNYNEFYEARHFASGENLSTYVTLKNGQQVSVDTDFIFSCKQLPKLLLASNEAQFDEIFEEFVGKRNAMGYQEVLKQKTVLMNAAKEKMGISE